MAGETPVGRDSRESSGDMMMMRPSVNSFSYSEPAYIVDR